MTFRLCKFLVLLGALLTVFSACTLRAGDQTVEVLYFPEVVFKGDPLSIHIRSSIEDQLQVFSNEALKSRPKVLAGELLEVTLFPSESCSLFVLASSGEKFAQFKVLQPGFEGKLTEKDGYLYQGTLPLILMPDHRLPPPLDRRWQTVDLVENLMQTQKPRIRSFLAYLPKSSKLPPFLKSLFTETEMHLIRPVPESWFQMHGYLLAEQAQQPEDFVIFEADLVDLERGVTPQTLFLKWQFLLQHLQRKSGYVDGLLFGPEYDETTLQWKSILDEKLKGLAYAHGLRFVDRSLPVETWQARLKNRLGKRYQIP